jgi:arginine/ornithine N-succinyltransferase beta subunit
MLLTDGVTGSSPVWGAKGKHFFGSAFFNDAHLTVQEK